LIEILAGCGVYLLFYLIREKKVLKALDNQAFFISGKSFAVIFAAMLSAAILETIIFNADLSSIRTSEVLRGVTIIVLNVLLSFVAGLLVVNSTEGHYKEQYYKGVSQALSKQVDIQIRHYQEQKEHEETLAAFRHDYKNLVLCLQAILEANEIDLALEFLGQMNLRTDPQMATFDSGNYIADAMISDKAKLAAAHSTEIHFNGFIPSSRIENYDICAILANALDNAIEACEAIEGHSIITIQSDIQNSMWLLSIKNPVMHDVVIRHNRIASSKDDKALHGFGLINIEAAVKHNGGQMTLRCSNNIFSLEITAHLKQSPLRHVTPLPAPRADRRGARNKPLDPRAFS
jgi:sensor histidine kinase regulating citrate/malate metabolism